MFSHIRNYAKRSFSFLEPLIHVVEVGNNAYL